MPEQRLQRCRDAYKALPSVCDEMFAAVVWVSEDAEVPHWRTRLASAAYRITQAQLEADKRAIGR